MDHTQVRIHAGERYVEVRVPSAGDMPLVRGVLVQPPVGDLIHYGRYGAWVVEVRWPVGADEPTVTITEDGAAGQSRTEVSHGQSTR